MTGCPHFSDKTCANLRANTSVAPPGVCGTTNFTVRLGNCSALASGANGLRETTAATRPANNDPRCIAFPPLVTLGARNGRENLAIGGADATRLRASAGADYGVQNGKTSGSAQVSAIDSSGAWELPHEFRQMQDTARRFMRERVRPAEAPL